MDLLLLANTENSGMSLQLGDFDRLKKDYQLIRASEQRKTLQLEEALSEVAQCRELLTSVKIEDLESRVKESHIESFHNRSRDRVIKISVQKEGLKGEIEKLKKHVVTLSDEMTHLAH